MLQNHPARYSGAIIVAVIYLSFIAAILNIQNPIVQDFVNIGINLALIYVMINMAALIYGIITRNRKVRRSD